MRIFLVQLFSYERVQNYFSNRVLAFKIGPIEVQSTISYLFLAFCSFINLMKSHKTSRPKLNRLAHSGANNIPAGTMLGPGPGQEGLKERKKNVWKPVVDIKKQFHRRKKEQGIDSSCGCWANNSDDLVFIPLLSFKLQ